MTSPTTRNIAPVCACKGKRYCADCLDSERILERRNLTKDIYGDFKCYIYSSGQNNGICFHSSTITTNSSLDEVLGQDIMLDSSTTNLFINGITYIPNFLSVEEENFLVSEIDRREWSPSQSGRMKQDYGPKVNFKQKKVKIDKKFVGFPHYIDLILQKMNVLSSDYPVVDCFEPFEVCNLDYQSSRLSSIDMHKDDAWIWGERLISINLLADSVITLEDPGRRLLIYVPIRRRSLLCMTQDARYLLNHGILPQHVPERRVVITLREASNEFKECGIQYESYGREIARIARARCQ